MFLWVLGAGKSWKKATGPGNVLNSSKNIKCMAYSKENSHYELGSERVNVNASPGKINLSPEKVCKFVSEKKISCK